MSTPSPSRKLRTYDEDDIVKYALGLDVPVVGLVRDRDEYKEMREMALIHGAVLGLGRARLARASPTAPAPSAGEAESAPAPASSAPRAGAPA